MLYSNGFRTNLKPLIALLITKYSLKRVFKEKVYLKNLVDELLFVNKCSIGLNFFLIGQFSPYIIVPKTYYITRRIFI